MNYTAQGLASTVEISTSSNPFLLATVIFSSQPNIKFKNTKIAETGTSILSAAVADDVQWMFTPTDCSSEPIVLEIRREPIPIWNQVEIDSYKEWGCLVLF